MNLRLENDILFDQSNTTPNELILTFGINESQIGIYTDPVQDFSRSVELSLNGSAERPYRLRPTVLLLNAGIVHRVGPYRSSVDLSRKLAQNGFPVFRFDLSGLGDSEMRHEIPSDRERAFFDIQAAMNFLSERFGTQEFILYGLCSGADNGHVVALNDSRIVGCIFLDGFFYETPGYHFFYYWTRITDRRRWMNLFFRLGKKLKTILNTKGSRSPAPIGRTFVREFPPREQVETEIQQIVDRGTQMLYIYSAGTINHINYKGQFRAMFPQLKWKNSIEMEYYSHSDHTYTLLEGRECLHQRILRWTDRFGHSS
jgi:hypothetical protein